MQGSVAADDVAGSSAVSARSATRRCCSALLSEDRSRRWPPRVKEDIAAAAFLPDVDDQVDPFGVMISGLTVSVLHVRRAFGTMWRDAWSTSVRDALLGAVTEGSPLGVLEAVGFRRSFTAVADGLSGFSPPRVSFTARRWRS